MSMMLGEPLPLTRLTRVGGQRAEGKSEGLKKALKHELFARAPARDSRAWLLF